MDFRTEIQNVGHAFSWLEVAATPRLNSDVAMGWLCVSVLDLICQDPRDGEYQAVQTDRGRAKSSLAVIPDDMCPAFAWQNEVFPAVVVEVRNTDL